MSPELEQALSRARTLVDAMTPAEKAEMIRKQRESWIRAFEPCEHGEVDFEQCGKCWEKHS